MPSLRLRRAIRPLSATSHHTETSGSRRSLQAPDHENFQFFQTAQGVNFSLMNLYQLLAQNRISPRRAAILAYISSLLLRTLPQIDADKAAGIIDPTKSIDVSAADEDADANGDTDEDSDLDSDSETPTEKETETRLDSVNTWNPSIPEPDPEKKPS